MTKEGLEKLDFLLSGLIDKEHYEWHCKMDRERIEKFEPPMWEDIKEYYKFCFVIGEQCYCFTVDVFDIDIYICMEDMEGVESIFHKRTTKENYIKACEIVRELFNGGDKE